MSGTNEGDRDVREDVRAQIREFLSTRRDRITPQQAGLPVYGGDRRRVPGLRREEVATLAGISSEYYVRLERGTATGVSESVIEGVAHALQFNEAERAHLRDLLRTAGAARESRRRSGPQRVRSTVQRVLDSLVGSPAFVLNGRLDVLATNDLGAALFSPVFAAIEPPNTARFAFLDPQAKTFFVDWERVANDTVALLRADAGRNPYDRGLSDLIGELSTRSEDFRGRWAAHDVSIHSTGTKRLQHPVVGNLELSFDSFPVAGDASQSMVVYTAEPDSPSDDALRLLASWGAASAPAQESADRTADLS